MSQFTTAANLEMLENYKWKLIDEFEYHVGEYPSSNIIRVPSGFITDLASIPRILWGIFPPNGKYAKAAIIHDYLYHTGVISRKHSDEILLEGMKVLNVPYLTRYIIYYAVRLFGKKNYKN